MVTLTTAPSARGGPPPTFPFTKCVEPAASLVKLPSRKFTMFTLTRARTHARAREGVPNFPTNIRVA
jgi:hypothetical protein